jgi:hypothetical protein
MTENELFEADYLAAFPDSVGIDNIRYLIDIGLAQIPFAIWQQQRKRHEAEVAELVAALKGVVNHSEYHGLRDSTYLVCGCNECMARARANVVIAKFDAPKGEL